MKRMSRLGIAAALLLVFAGAAPAFAFPSVPISNWQPVMYCQGCHADFVASWSKTMHAQALSDPVYRYKIAQADAETSGSVTPFCTKCHGPLATMAGEIDRTDMSQLSTLGATGVTCEFCHHVTGTTEPIGNNSQTISTDTTTKIGPFFDSTSPGHLTAGSTFIESAEFCGSCHQVRHPGNGLVLEDTYGEWKASEYATLGVTCQDCHMTAGPGIPPGPGYASPIGPLRPKLYLMNWVGGNAVFGPADQATARLQSAATMTISAPAMAAPGSSAKVGVLITNIGAGHSIPTGITEIRQMWLEVVATNASGVEIMRQRREFGTVVEDAAGNFPAEMWNAVKIHSDDRIPAKGSAESSWTLALPSSGAVKIKAALYYRSFDPELAKAAGVTSEIPTITMTSLERTIATAKPASGLTIATSATSARIGRSFILSGLATPGAMMLGRTMHVNVKKPNKPYWSYSSRRIIYSNAGKSSWWYRYTLLSTSPRGTYQFQGFYDGAADLAASHSGVVKVSVR